MTLRSRLVNLESRLGGNEVRGPADLVSLDAAGRIPWDGNEALRPWVGLQLGELPARWLEIPWPIQVVRDIDPRIVLGLDQLL